MPWTVRPNDKNCPPDRPWSVRNTETGSLEGCHPTREDALEQVAALHANEELAAQIVKQATRQVAVFAALDDLDLEPTAGMVEEARRGLDWRDELNRGGTAVGISRARDIVNRRRLSPDTVKRMNSYFARHEVDKQAEGFSPGEDGYPSNGRIAWALWGGDAGQRWAATKVEQIRRIEDER
jgi:hypothetical protein